MHFRNFGFLICLIFCVASVSCRRNKKDDALELEDDDAFTINKVKSTQKQNKRSVSGKGEVGNWKSIMRKKSSYMENLHAQNNYSIIPLSANGFRQFVMSTPRDYSVFVLFYNGNKKECPLCHESISYWSWITQVYYYQASQTNQQRDMFYFVVVDIDKNMHKINLDLARDDPNYYHFGRATVKNHNPIDIFLPQVRGRDIEATNNWIQEITGIEIKVPKSDSTFLWKFFGMIAVILGFIAYRFDIVDLNWKAIHKFIINFNYCYWTIILIVYCVSGQVYNAIRNTGFAYLNSDGGITFIAHSARDQLITESLIIMTIYLVMIYSMIKLIENKEKEHLEGKSTEITSALNYNALYFAIALIVLLNIIKIKS